MWVYTIRAEELKQELLHNELSLTEWDEGFVPDDVENVCSIIQDWVKGEFGDIGKLVMVWDKYYDYGFGGGSRLFLVRGLDIYELSIPLIDGDFASLVYELESIIKNKKDPNYTNLNLEYYGYTHNAAPEKWEN